jgi:hypothetical protein
VTRRALQLILIKRVWLDGGSLVHRDNVKDSWVRSRATDVCLGMRFAVTAGLINALWDD